MTVAELDWATTDTADFMAACRGFPLDFRLRWALTVPEVLASESGPVHPRSVAAARNRRVAIHIIRDVCGLTGPQVAPIVGMSVFSTNKAAYSHRQRHRYLVEPTRSRSEVALCDDWLDCVARAMYEAFDDPELAQEAKEAG